MFSWAATHKLKPLISITANNMFFKKCLYQFLQKTSQHKLEKDKLIKAFVLLVGK
jgi:hypothetical protein